jgi:hypothetical protein
VSRGGANYKKVASDLMAIQDTDLLAINRGGSNYKCTVAELKDYAGAPAGGIEWETNPLPQPAFFQSTPRASGGNQRLVDCSPDVMCLAVTGGIARTVNGKDWTYSNLGFNPPFVYYGGNKTWLTQNRKSLDDGLTWTPTSTNIGNGILIAPNPWNKTGGSSFVSPIFTIGWEGPSYLNGIAETTDGGDTWVTTNLPSPIVIGYPDGQGGRPNAMGMIVSRRNNGDPVFYFVVNKPPEFWGVHQSIGNYTSFSATGGGGGGNRQFLGYVRNRIGGGFVYLETSPVDLAPAGATPTIWGGEGSSSEILLPVGNEYGSGATLTFANNAKYMAAYNNPNSINPSAPVGMNYNSYPRPAGSPDIIQQVAGINGFGPMTIFKNRIVGFSTTSCIKQV